MNFFFGGSPDTGPSSSEQPSMQHARAFETAANAIFQSNTNIVDWNLSYVEISGDTSVLKWIGTLAQDIGQRIANRVEEQQDRDNQTGTTTAKVTIGLNPGKHDSHIVNALIGELSQAATSNNGRVSSTGTYFPNENTVVNIRYEFS